MPHNIRLEKKAHARAIGFADVARAQDNLAAKDDQVRAQNKAAHRARTRSLLDGQMKEIAARKVHALRWKTAALLFVCLHNSICAHLEHPR